MYADVTLPRVLSSHMVVQRDLPVHVWGWAKAGETVTASFRGASRTTQADELGQWSIYLPPGAAGGPFAMTVKGANTVTLEDVLVGDVWVAGGQSNMEFEMRKAATAAADLPHAGNSHIRLMIVSRTASEYPLTDVNSDPKGNGYGWTASTPESAKDFSAVAWYFAREIEEKEHVPIGVIDSTWGGTLAESWTSLTALGADPGLASIFTARGHMTEREASALLRDDVLQKALAEARATGKPAPKYPWHPLLTMWAPSALYNGMIAPLTPFPIKGVVWYQGESNSPLERYPTYERLFRTMIEDWRHHWGVGDFPFLFVQLANFKSDATEEYFQIREAQRRSLELRNTAMAVTIDVGNPDNVHPTDKLTVGHRLALAGLAVAYGGKQEYSGPLYRQVTPEGASLRVWFDHAQGLKTMGGALTGFEIAGGDGKYAPAEARIEGDTVVLTSPSVALPVAARYGWTNSPECHLYNGEGLPASPFNSVP